MTQDNILEIDVNKLNFDIILYVIIQINPYII